MTLQMRILSFAALVFLSVSGFAGTPAQIPYYGEKFYRSYNQADGQELVQLLKEVLSSPHQRQAGKPDVIGNCNGGKDCYRHRSVGYDHARKFILGNFYLVHEGNQYAVKDVYCEREYGAPGPNKIPDNTKVNVEHTWPQSRFTKQHPTDMQKSDLHHLFPTDSELNSIRGNFPFGEVSQDKKQLKCNCSRFGFTTRGNQLIFEPPVAHQGNVARALFYFAVRYDMQIDQDQEAFLKKWNREDPVDETERQRNDEIYELQGNRNPFVDYPELAEKISDF